MKRLKLLTLTFALMACTTIAAKDYTVKSPDGRITVTTTNGQLLNVTHDGRTITTVNASLFASKGIRSAKTSAINETITATFYRQKSFSVSANQLDLKLGSDCGLHIRAYNEGIAYRF